MKKVLALLVGIFMLMGCAGGQVVVTDLCTIAGNAAGVYIAAKYPEIAPEISVTAQAILIDVQAGKVSSTDFQSAINLLLSKVNMDANVKLLLTEVVDSINVSFTIGTANVDAENAINGFIKGLGSVQQIKVKKALRK